MLGLLPPLERLVVVVAGDALHQLVNDSTEAFILSGRVDQQPPENDLAPGVQLAFLSVLSGEQSLIPGLRLFDLLFCLLDRCHFSSRTNWVQWSDVIPIPA